MSLEGCPSLSGIVPVSSDEDVSGVDPLMEAMHMLVPFEAGDPPIMVDPPMLGLGLEAGDPIPLHDKDMSDADSHENPSQSLPAKRRRISTKRRDSSRDPWSVPVITPRVLPRRGSEVLGERCGLPGMCVRRAKRLGLPTWLFTIMTLLCMNPLIDTSPRFHAVEFYAGKGTIYNAFEEHGCKAAKLDKSYGSDPQYDFTSPEGLVCLIFYILCLRLRGLNFHAIVCSTWVWMSRSSTGRTNSRPSGNESEVVRLANLMVTRACLMIRLAASKFCRWAIEQPATSTLPRFKRMRQLAKAPDALMCGPFTTVRTNMRAFGGPTLKPTLVLGNPWVALLGREGHVIKETGTGHKLVHAFVDKKGVRRVTGRARELKASQEYPDLFGQAVYRHFQETMIPSHEWQMEEYDVDTTDDETDLWEDALNPGIAVEELYAIAKTFGQQPAN